MLPLGGPSLLALDLPMMSCVGRRSAIICHGFMVADVPHCIVANGNDRRAKRTGILETDTLQASMWTVKQGEPASSLIAIAEVVRHTESQGTPREFKEMHFLSQQRRKPEQASVDAFSRSKDGDKQ